MSSATAAVPGAGISLRPDALTRLRRVQPSDAVAGWLGPLGVFLFALMLRLHRLSIPAKEAFDEVYYRKDAFDLLRYGAERNVEGTGPGFVVHPHLGKWMIAIGEKMFGYNAFGWRFGAALFGSLTVLILCRAGRRLTGSTVLGCFAGLLLALDGLHFVQSRVAMLDIFLCFWIVAAFACLLVDRDQTRARMADWVEEHGSPTDLLGPWLGVRWWRVGAFACLGAGLATKWSAIWYLGVFGLLIIAWDTGMRRTAGMAAPLRATAVWAVIELILIGLVLPFVIYVASWFGYFATDDGWRRSCTGQWANGDGCGAISGWWRYHREIWGFHTGLTKGHPYESKPFAWPFLARPVSYYYTSPKAANGANGAKEILGIGTPMIWWIGFLAVLGCIAQWVRARDWRAAAIVIGWATAIVPWFVDLERTMFLFYALPAVPFLCLALALVAGTLIGPATGSLRRRRWMAGAVAAYGVTVIWNFVFFYPILAAKVIPYTEWQDRIWFSSWI